jgi:hypoxanthine phosphoribosyltransferase
MNTSRERSPSVMNRDITWDEVGAWCERIVLRVKSETPDIKLVAGIARGGLIPAAIIAYRLGIPTIPISLMNDPFYVIDMDPKDVLIVDDVCDTGQTFKELNAYLRGIEFPTAVLLAKPWISEPRDHFFQPRFIAEWTTEWAVFPWEK